MNFNKNNAPFFWRNMITRALLIVASIALIISFLPRNDTQTFKYEVGMPWMYGTFIAKFDFPIYKSEEVYKHECDSILDEFQPYYSMNSNVEKQQIAKLEKDYQDGLPGLPEGYLRIVTNRLHRIYQAGVLSTQDYSALAADTTRQVRIIKGKETESRYISYLYSTRTAYGQLFIDDDMGELRQALQKCNLNDYIVPNIIYDKSRTDNERESMLATVPLTKGVVRTGQKIIDRGELVDDYADRAITSFIKEKNRRNIDNNEVRDTLVGQLIYVSMIILLFSSYLYLFRIDYFDKPRTILMLYLLITLFPILTSLVMSHNFFSVYIVPYCITAIFVRVFMDSRTAFVTHSTMVLLCAAAVNYQYEFLIVELLAGMVAVYSLREMSSRAQVLKTSLLVALASIAAFFSLQLMQSNDLSKLDSDMYVHFMVNGVLLLLAYPMMYLVEKLFDFNSDITLFELSNTNKGALRELSEVAPGTFQHSITVGNLASAIANRIGADSLLVRVGALYHDIGKMTNPAYFTENQVSGVNPHNNLSNIKSAQIIISHVTDGIGVAERYDLPQFIKDFILTHQGRGITRYFYIKEQNEHPDEKIDSAPFTYPGPNPHTREQAILMMADATEAASRSLREHTEEEISNLVNRIIDMQVTEGYFKECPITFRDIMLAKNVLIERLKALYHTRVAYPEMKKEVDPLTPPDNSEPTSQPNNKTTKQQNNQ